jgi:hypothetical protein
LQPKQACSTAGLQPIMQHLGAEWEQTSNTLFTVQNWLDESGDGAVAPWEPYTTTADGNSNSMQDAAYGEDPQLYAAQAAADSQLQVSRRSIFTSCCQPEAHNDKNFPRAVC